MGSEESNEPTFTWTARQLASCCVWSPERPDTTVLFAAEELARYLQRIVGRDIPVAARPELSQHSLAVAPFGSNFTMPPSASPLVGFTIEPGADAIMVRGDTSSALLRGVYRLLQELGCEWSVRGRLYETVPTAATETFCLRAYRSAPRFQSVVYCSDIITWHYTQPELLRERIVEDEELADWMAKTGATSFFFIRHPFDTKSAIEELQKSFSTRGITVEVGGHVLPTLLDRQWFPRHPEYFPLTHGGRRSETGNLCVSHPRARALVAEQAGHFLTAAGYAGALHIWGADVFGGGWCHCTHCEKLSPQEQSIVVCNAIAERLENAGVRVPIYYLAYHDTIEPRLRIEPHPMVWCEFAPRERCYGHHIGDRECGVNEHYRAALESYIQLFRGRVRAFEYYGDAILFFGCLVPIPRVIASDLATYEALGVREVSFLQFGQFSRWAYAPNFTAFAAASQGIPIGPALERLWSQWDGKAQVVGSVFADLEETMRALVRYGDVRLPPKRRTQRSDLRRALSAHLPRFTAMADELDSHRSPSLHALALLVRYTQTVFEGVAHELDTGQAADAIFSHALSILQSVDRTYKGVWGEFDLAVIHDLYKAAHLVPGWS